MPFCYDPTLMVYVLRLTVWSSGVMLYVMLACRYPVRLLCCTLCCLSACRLSCVAIAVLKYRTRHPQKRDFMPQ